MDFPRLITLVFFGLSEVKYSAITSHMTQSKGKKEVKTIEPKKIIVTNKKEFHMYRHRLVFSCPTCGKIDKYKTRRTKQGNADF